MDQLFLNLTHMKKYQYTDKGKEQIKAVPGTLIIKNGHSIKLATITDAQCELLGESTWYTKKERPNKPEK